MENIYFWNWEYIMVTEKSTITCPQCGFEKEETLPIDACQFFYECKYCHVKLKPKEGDCCVFCSYGTVQCPSQQKEKGCY